MAGNQARGSAELNHLRRFDRLPQAFRRLLWRAAENWQAGWIEQLIVTHGEQRAYQEARRVIATEEQALIIEHYGRSHPQVRG